MYKDTKGFITGRVGHLLKDLAAAQALDFIHQSTNKKAKESNRTDVGLARHKYVKELLSKSAKSIKP